MSWSLVVTVTATALSAATAVPQLWRLRRHPPTGVSLAAAGNATVNGFAWMLYGAGTGTFALVVASAGPAAGATAVAVTVARSGGRRGLMLVAAWTGWARWRHHTRATREPAGAHPPADLLVQQA